MTGSEIGDQLGFYSSLFTPDQLSELAKCNDVEQEVPSGMFAGMYIKVEELAEGRSKLASSCAHNDLLPENGTRPVSDRLLINWSRN